MRKTRPIQPPPLQSILRVRKTFRHRAAGIGTMAGETLIVLPAAIITPLQPKKIDLVVRAKSGERLRQVVPQEASIALRWRMPPLACQLARPVRVSWVEMFLECLRLLSVDNSESINAFTQTIEVITICMHAQHSTIKLLSRASALNLQKKSYSS